MIQIKKNVFHKDLFPNENVLPTFNSDDIERVLGNIKGISECFFIFK